jgi:jasmonate ZIM domain-containing protein
MLIAAAAAAATKSNSTNAVKPLAMPLTNAAVSPVLTRSPSLQSTSVATGQLQALADPSSICKLQAGKTNKSYYEVQKWDILILLDVI